MWLNYLNRDARWLDVEVDLGAALAQAERAQPQPQRLAGNG